MHRNSFAYLQQQSLHLRSKRGIRQVRFHWWSWMGWVYDDSEESASSALPVRPSYPTAFPCPVPMSRSNLSLLHRDCSWLTVWTLGLSGRPSSTCVTITTTTAAALTCLHLDSTLDGLLTSRHRSVGVSPALILELVIVDRFSAAVAVKCSNKHECVLSVGLLHQGGCSWICVPTCHCDYNKTWTLLFYFLLL